MVRKIVNSGRCKALHSLRLQLQKQAIFKIKNPVTGAGNFFRFS